MSSSNLYGDFAENPDYLLALMLSAPSVEPPDALASATIEFARTEVVARVKHEQLASTGPRLLASKQTIFAAILLHHLLSQRGSEFADSLVDRASAFGSRAARVNADFSPSFHNGWYPLGHSPDADSSTFFQELDISPQDLGVAQQRTAAALAYLEREGAAIA